jgi:hypothetical protein
VVASPEVKIAIHKRVITATAANPDFTYPLGRPHIKTCSSEVKEREKTLIPLL